MSLSTRTEQGRTSTARNQLYTIMQTLSCTLVLFAVMTSSTQASKRTMNDFPTLDVDSLNNVLDALDSHLEVFRKRSCDVGIQSHNCVLSDLDNLMNAQSFFSSGHSPGKRSSGGTLEGQGQNKRVIPRNILQETLALQNDVMEQRKVIQRLKQALQEHRQPEQEEALPNKKNCRFRLGGHCLTEAMDRAATQIYYLRSPDSPGRRRRSTAGTNSGHDVRTQESVRAQSENESESKTERR